MSALGSSVINKSGKKFAPKAPARRPAAPASTQASASHSADRRLQSQTPQPQHAPQLVVASPTPSVSLPTPALTQHPDAAASAKAAQHGEAVAVPAPSQKIPALEPSASHDTATTLPIPCNRTPTQKRTSPVIPQKRPSEPRQVPGLRATGRTLQPGHVLGPTCQPAALSEPNHPYSDFSSTVNTRITLGQDTVSNDSGRSAATVPSDPLITQDNIHAPTAKRRRVEGPQLTALAVQPSASDTGTNVPLPTTEINEAVRGESQNAEPGSAIPQLAKTEKPKLSAQAKRLQGIEDAAAAIVADATRSPSAKAKRPRKKPKGKEVQRGGGEASSAAAGASSDTNGPTGQDAAPAKPKRKRYTTQTAEDAAAEVVEEVVGRLTKDPKKRGRKDGKRAATPEGADAVVIAPSEVRMSDLCRDNRTGRKSEREKDLAELERAELVRKKQNRLQEIIGHVEPDKEPAFSESPIARLERLEHLGRQREREESVAENVPNTIIVNGQIQIDEDSLQIDRHAAAAAARADEDIESVDENALTRKVNSASWLKRDTSGGWNEDLTEKFYEGLRMFGTDFQMIKTMFPGRSRHKIKLKFVKEEKVNYDKIKATLLGEKIPVDLPELEKMAGVEFADPKELEREMDEDRKRLEEETLAEKEEMDNARRERDELIAAERAAAGEESSAKENRRGKSKRKKGEKHKGKKGASRRKEKYPSKCASGGADVLGEIRGVLGFE